MSESKCEIIQDILPLYIDELVSSETKRFVEEHVASCNKCKNELSILKKNIICMSSVNICEASVEPLRKIKKQIRKKKIIIILITTMMVLTLSVATTFLLLEYGRKASLNDLDFKIEYQYDEQAYLKQTLVLHMKLSNGKELLPMSKDIYKKNSEGNEVWVGTTIELRESLINRKYKSKHYTVSYAIQKNDVERLVKDDFIFSVITKEGIKQFSVIEEGILEYQKDKVNSENADR